MLFFELTAEGIEARIGYVGEAIQHSENEEYRRIGAKSNAWVTALDPEQGHAANGSPLGEDCRRDSSASTGVTDVPTEFAECAGNWNRLIKRLSAHDI